MILHDRLLRESSQRFNNRLEELNCDLEWLYDRLYELNLSFCMQDLETYRSGIQLPTLTVAYAISDVLGVSLDWLLGRD